MSPSVVVCLLSPKNSNYQVLEEFNQYESFNAVQQEIPGGVYTTFRTFQRTKVVNLTDHFTRLRESARILGHSISLNSRNIRNAARQILDKYGFNENRIRLSLDLSVRPGELYIMVEPLVVPSRVDYDRGVKVCTFNLHRENPKAKSTEFVGQADKVRASIGPGVNEIVMVGPDGKLLEGLSSNFFAIKDNVVWTEDEAVLPGLTRKVVMGLMREMFEGDALRIFGRE
jgi:branched-chain amino acid aminotransferase